jgi:hypothetical protein
MSSFKTPRTYAKLASRHCSTWIPKRLESPLAPSSLVTIFFDCAQTTLPAVRAEQKPGTRARLLRLCDGIKRVPHVAECVKFNARHGKSSWRFYLCSDAEIAIITSRTTKEIAAKRAELQ